MRYTYNLYEERHISNERKGSKAKKKFLLLLFYEETHEKIDQVKNVQKKKATACVSGVLKLYSRGGNSCFGSWCFLVLFGFHLVSFGFFWCCLVFIWLFLVLFGVHLAFIWGYLVFFGFNINFLKFYFWLKFLKKSIFLVHKV